ncbi:DUF4120 family protein [uncultured Alistipes sp.]|uniref:DUF4120 family protein n=1 Tax=uncultured Alistipes sp. TaxID=538949 RepID=UPI00266C4E9E|nr:DUF4120 family protein [uncultured Alistipes sp.]
MKIMCQEYFDAVVRYAESIGDCTLQECLDRLERWGQNARQASEIVLYRDFAPYSFFFKQRYADGSLEVVGGLVYHGLPDCSCCYTLEKINGWTLHT